MLKRIRLSSSGVTLIEYALLLSLISFVCLTVILGVGRNSRDTFFRVATATGSASPTITIDDFSPFGGPAGGSDPRDTTAGGGEPGEPIEPCQPIPGGPSSGGTQGTCATTPNTNNP